MNKTEGMIDRPQEIAELGYEAHLAKSLMLPSHMLCWRVEQRGYG